MREDQQRTSTSDGQVSAILIESIRLPCALLNARGTVEAGNAAWREQHSSPLFVGVGVDFFEPLARSSKTEHAREQIHDVASGKTERAVTDAFSADSSARRHYRLIASRRPEGGAFVLAADITDHVNTAEWLRESEERFRRMVESIHDYAVFTLDESGRVATWNKGAARTTGYQANEILGRPWAAFFAEEDRASGLPVEQLASAATSGQCEAEGWRVRRDGTKFWCSTLLTALRDASGGVRGYSKVIRDLTEPRQIQFALLDSQTRLAGIIDSAMDAIFTVDESQRIVMFNHAAERTFGVKAEVVLGGTVERFVPHRFRGTHPEIISSFGQTGVTNPAMGHLGTVRGLRSDGTEFPIEASISVAIAGGRKFYTVILRDVSQRQQLEEQLLQAQKMEGIGRLAGGVAHDFNNMLTAMFGYLGLASAQIGTSHPAQGSLSQAREAAERASTLTRQLLTFARKQIVSPEVLCPGKVVTGLEPMLRRLIGDDVLLRTSIAPDTGNVRADASQLEQVIVNLAVNARDAMPRGGELSISARNITLDDQYCVARVGSTPGAHVEVSVADTGVGMSPEVLERLFEPFFTTKGPGKGTGLGLATCHGIVRQSGGHIVVESQLDHGTSVKVYLPRTDSEPASPVRPSEKSRPAGGFETILLVEDNEMVRTLVAQGLRSAGYNVLVEEAGPPALRTAATHAGALDLLLTDVVMPEMSGVQLAEQLRRTRPTLPVICMSGYTEETIVHHGVTAEGMAFIAKPFVIETLLQKVRSILDHARA